MVKMSSEVQSHFFFVKVPAGQEVEIALMLKRKALEQGGDIRSILSFEKLKGFIFVEAVHVYDVRKLIYGIPRVRLPYGSRPVSLDEIREYIGRIPKKIVVKPGDIVSIIDGLFKGQKGRVKAINPDKKMVTIELLDETRKWDIHIGIDHINVEERKDEEGDKGTG